MSHAWDVNIKSASVQLLTDPDRAQYEVDNRCTKCGIVNDYIIVHRLLDGTVEYHFSGNITVECPFDTVSEVLGS